MLESDRFGNIFGCEAVSTALFNLCFETYIPRFCQLSNYRTNIIVRLTLLIRST